VLGNCEQELFLARREVVEELALAGPSAMADVIQSDGRGALDSDLGRGTLDDPRPGRGPLGG
jgi:hypothetical protein